MAFRATTKRNERGARKIGREKVKLAIGETREYPVNTKERGRERERGRGGNGRDNRQRYAKESASFGRGTNDKEYL